MDQRKEEKKRSRAQMEHHECPCYHFTINRVGGIMLLLLT